MKIYLAGDLRTGWQDKAAAYLEGHELLDPRTWQDRNPAVYTKRDIEAVTSADVLLAYMGPENPSGYGLSVELGYAAALGKRIIFVDKMHKDWRSKYFGMHREMATEVINDFSEIKI